MNRDEACAKLTFLNGRIVDLCMETRIKDMDKLLHNLEECIKMIQFVILHDKGTTLDENHS